MPATNLVRYNELEYLNFTMPNGGTIALTRRGTGSVRRYLYYTKNGKTWTSWSFSANAGQYGNGQYTPITMQPGEKIWIRNDSETSTGFSAGSANHFQFEFSNTVYAAGNVMSLKCRYPNVAYGGAYSFCKLFMDCTTLITPPEILTSYAPQGFAYCMFQRCSNLEYAPELHMTNINTNGYCYYYMFQGCTKINMVKLHATSFPTANCTTNWLSGVASTGDIWCPSSLNLANNSVSGIPQGWTRHDL